MILNIVKLIIKYIFNVNLHRMFILFSLVYKV
jgi:hypothetical protein